MKKNVITSETIFEVFLIVVSIGLSCLMYKIDGYKMVVLNLFFLPTVLSAFFLGRYRAGVLALFCLDCFFSTAVRVESVHKLGRIGSHWANYM